MGRGDRGGFEHALSLNATLVDARDPIGCRARDGEEDALDKLGLVLRFSHCGETIDGAASSEQRTVLDRLALEPGFVSGFVVGCHVWDVMVPARHARG